MSNITTGWLKKETQHGLAGALRRFERRWVVVSGSSLSYYKRDDQNSGPALGVIELTGKRILLEPDTDHGFKFELYDEDNTYNFNCETKSDREKWVDAISCICYAPYGGGMFGATIEAAVKREKVHGGGNVPKIIAQCIGYLDNTIRLQENGIFRLPGNERTVKDLKMEFQQGLEPNLELKADTHTIGSLLKLYLRNLTDSVIPSCLYEDFVAVILTYEFNQKEGLHELKHLLNRLPSSNYNTMRKLTGFLNKVQSYSHVNRMDISNLAIVFAPTFLKNNSGDLNLEMSDMTKIKKVTEILIDKCDVLFPTDKEEEVENSVDLDNIDHDMLKNLYSVMMIKYQVQGKELLSKDKELEALRAKLLDFEKLHQKHENRINFLEDHVKRLNQQLEGPPTENIPMPPPRHSGTILSSPKLRQNTTTSPNLCRASPVTSSKGPAIKPRPKTGNFRSWD